MKFNPQFLFSAEAAGGQNVRVAYKPGDGAAGISCHFEIRRATMASAQTATFRLFQLGEKTRDLLQKDWFNLSDVRAVQFSAAYAGDPLTMVFNGTIKQAQSTKAPGATEIVTEVEAFDGGAAMANGYSLKSIAAGTSFSDLIKNLAADLPGISKNAIIGTVPGKTTRGSAFAGNTWNYIFQLSDGLATIDNNQLQVLAPNEYSGASIPVINSQSGLLGSPRRFNQMMQVRMLFEPAFVIGQLVDLESTVLPKFNGRYKVMGLVHRGAIGPTESGERVTELTLWTGLGDASSWVPVAAAPLP